jgi:hypothetical protein
MAIAKGSAALYPVGDGAAKTYMLTKQCPTDTQSLPPGTMVEVLDATDKGYIVKARGKEYHILFNALERSVKKGAADVLPVNDGVAKGSAALGHEKQMTPGTYLLKCAKAALKDGESEEIFVKQFKPEAQNMARTAYKAAQGGRTTDAESTELQAARAAYVKATKAPSTPKAYKLSLLAKVQALEVKEKSQSRATDSLEVSDRVVYKGKACTVVQVYGHGVDLRSDDGDKYMGVAVEKLVGKKRATDVLPVPVGDTQLVKSGAMARDRAKASDAMVIKALRIRAGDAKPFTVNPGPLATAGSNRVLERIAELQTIQMRNKPGTKAWEGASKELQPLFTHMAKLQGQVKRNGGHTGDVMPVADAYTVGDPVNIRGNKGVGVVTKTLSMPKIGPYYEVKIDGRGVREYYQPHELSAQSN